MAPNYGIPFAGGLGDAPAGQDNGAGGSSGWSMPSWMSNAGNSGLLGSLGSIAGSMFTNPTAPYNNAMQQYQQYAQMGQQAMSPYMQAGQGAIPGFQQWLQSMSNPTQFTNNLMNNYQESPNARYMQEQAIRSAQNAGSATGMVNSTPYTQQVQQNSANISQQDMGNWMQNVLGLNTQYGQGMSNMIGMGENAGNSLLDLYGNEANSMANMQYGKGQAQNQQTGGLISGIAGVIGDIL